MYTAITVFLAFLFLLAMAATIIAMFISLGKAGDERRKMIVEKSSTHTLAVIVCYFLLCIIENIAKVFSGYDLSPEGLNPFAVLAVTAVIYILHLLYYRRKFGD